jgi:hypothetical protein
MKLFRVGIACMLHGSVLIEAETEQQAIRLAEEKRHQLRDIEGEEVLTPDRVYGANFIKDLPEEIA